MSAFDVLVSGAMLAQTVRMTVPYVAAALGGVLSERSGVVNIALEGTLLASALTSVAVHHATGSASAGVVSGVACGALVGLLHAALVVRGRVDAIVSGLAINIMAAGGTRFALRALYGSTSNSPTIDGFRWHEGAPLFVRTLFDPFVMATVLAVMAISYVIAQTPFGLRLRACGEDPASARAVGVHVTKTRTVAVALGGAVTGIGGAALAYDLHQFQAGMTSGRGYIALAAVVVSGWSAPYAALACVAFASLDALQIVLQNQARAPAQLFAMLPYAATLLALVVVRRRTAPPAALGKPF